MQKNVFLQIRQFKEPASQRWSQSADSNNITANDKHLLLFQIRMGLNLCHKSSSWIP